MKEKKNNFFTIFIDGAVVVAVLLIIVAATVWIVRLTSDGSQRDSIAEANEKIVEILKQHSDALEEHKKAINDLKGRLNGLGFILERTRPGTVLVEGNDPVSVESAQTQEEVQETEK
jgi:hypothetical protein